MAQVRSAALLSVMILLVGLACGGCAYMQDRGGDLMDIFDVGITVSKKPGFALYAGFNNIIPVGGGYMEGWLLGMGNRHVGVVAARHRTVGLILWGRERLGYDNFQRDDPDTPAYWRNGLFGLIQGPTPDRRNLLSCPKMIHVGWVGVLLTCKIGEIADFLLGWTTLDIMKDDALGKEPPPPALAPGRGTM